MNTTFRLLFGSCLCAVLAFTIVAADGNVNESPAPVRVVTNPFLKPNKHDNGMADPDVIRIEQDGKPMYILTHTVGSGHDFPYYTSPNLADWKLSGHLLGISTDPGNSVQMGDYHYCNMWAPEIRPTFSGGYILTFTASRFSTAQKPCPGYDEGSGVFVSWSVSPFGPYNSVNNHPQPSGANMDPNAPYCTQSMHDSIPFSHLVDYHDCGNDDGLLCNNTMRLDSDLFNDPLTNESWFSYAWYSNSEVLTPFDQSQLGEHVSVVRVNASDPRYVECSTEAATKVWVASPHDNNTLELLGAYCPRCEEQLSFAKGRLNETMQRDGVIWGVNEAPMIFRRKGFVYLLASHSAWDSAYYSVMWIAAPTVEGLSLDNPHRLVGRFLVPSLGQSFGHGTAVLGPDNEHYYYIHHHLNHTTCDSPTENCARDLYISPLNFHDRGDGLGDAWIDAIFPAEALKVNVFQATSDSTTRGAVEREEDDSIPPSVVDAIALA